LPSFPQNARFHRRTFETAISIIIPIFLTTYGTMSGAAPAVTYLAVYLGYIPVLA